MGLGITISVALNINNKFEVLKKQKDHLHSSKIGSDCFLFGLFSKSLGLHEGNRGSKITSSHVENYLNEKI